MSFEPGVEFEDYQSSNSQAVLFLSLKGLSKALAYIEKNSFDGKMISGTLKNGRYCYPTRLDNHQIHIPISHIILVYNDQIPDDRSYQASHLCHDKDCTLIEHLVWETKAENLSRLICQKAKQCKCDNVVKCKLGEHE
jgi:hypothetical protein